MLMGKNLNSVGELPEREILASEALKSIVAGRSHRGPGDPREPVHIPDRGLGTDFAANRPPGFNYQTHGF